jgi:cytochrome d ubiquinol oxidase subunit II
MLALLLGVVLGNVIQGMQVGDNFDYAGTGFFEFLTPYPLVMDYFLIGYDVARSIVPYV